MTKREPDLAACWPRQELAQRHKISVSLLVEPATANNELLPEITDVSDRTAEAAHAELRKSEQDLDRGSRSVTIFDRGDDGHSVHGVRSLASSPLFLLRHHLSTSSRNSSATLSLARCSASRHFPITRSWFGFRPVSGRPND
jgi:hypothetical protein